jgi:hypothetical protein
MQKSTDRSRWRHGRAEEILRVKLGGKASKASARITAEGVVATYIAGGVGALVEVNSKPTSLRKTTTSWHWQTMPPAGR